MKRPVSFKIDSGVWLKAKNAKLKGLASKIEKLIADETMGKTKKCPYCGK